MIICLDIYDAQISEQMHYMKITKLFSHPETFAISGINMTLLYQLAADLEPSGNLSLIMAIVWIINSDYARYTVTSVTLGQFSHSEEKKHYHYDLIDEILKRATIYRKHNTDSSTKIKFYIEGETMYSNGILLNKLFNSDDDIFQPDHGRDKAIWFMDSLESFNRLESNILSPLSKFRRNGHFCIIYTSTSSNRMQTIKTIFQRLFLKYVTNINVIIMIGKTPYVYTYFPFDASNCQASTPKLHASFAGIRDTEDFQLKKRFFPLKLHNMQGCKLAVATCHIPPMVFLEYNDNKTDEFPRIHGIEGNILNLLAERMNFSINLIIPPDGRGQVFKNGTATGALKMVLEGKVNFTISNYLYEKTRADYLLPSQIYLNIPLVVAIPKGHPMSPLERLTKPFKYIIWSCLSSSLLLGMFVILSLKLLNKVRISHFVFGNLNRIPLTNLWSIFFGSTISGVLPRRNFARYLLALWLLYTFILRNAYIAELFIILQDGRAKKTLKTISEVVRNNYTIYTPFIHHSLGKAKIEFLDTAKPNYGPNLLKELNNKNAKKVALLLGHTVRYFNLGIHDPHERIDVLPEIVFTVPITLYMRQNSYLRDRLDEILINIMAAGLIRQSESFYLEANYNFIKPTQAPIPLSLWLLFGLFSVYIVLLIFCSLVFLLELWSNNSPIARSIIDFFNC